MCCLGGVSEKKTVINELDRLIGNQTNQPMCRQQIIFVDVAARHAPRGGAPSKTKTTF